MSEPYEKVKAGRLIFKGGDLAAVKSIDKKKKSKKKKHKQLEEDEERQNDAGIEGEGSDLLENVGGDAYTIDAAKKMKYEELFPVESRKFGYDPANMSRTGERTVEEALDDRVKKKADRYCK